MLGCKDSWDKFEKAAMELSKALGEFSDSMDSFRKVLCDPLFLRDIGRKEMGIKIKLPRTKFSRN